MNEYVITCCSTADMTDDYFRKRDIPYVCFHFIMDGKTYPDDLGKSMPFSEFYGRISAGSQPSTSQVNTEEFKEFFRPYLEQGKDIIHVSLSSGLSGAYSAACAARLELLADYPLRRIKIIDSLGASSGYGLLVDMLADMRDKGASYEDVNGWAEANKLTVHHWFFSTNLSSYIKGGRISKAAGIVGTLLKICPLLDMDAAGHLIPRENIRTKKKAMQQIVDKMKQHAKGGDGYSDKCFISNSACPDDAKAVAAMVEEAFPRLNGRVLINSVGTVIGSHTGPGTLAMFFLGDERI